MAVQAAVPTLRDPELAAAGEELILGAARALPALLRVRERFARERPLDGLRVSACLPATPELANLMATLRVGGAQVAFRAADRRPTDDAVAAALLRWGVGVGAVRGDGQEDQDVQLAALLAHRPNLVLDHDARLALALHRGDGRLAGRVLVGTEQTAAGVTRLEAMAAGGELRYPVIAVNEKDPGGLLAGQALWIERAALGHAQLNRQVHELPWFTEERG
jgi:adenosylhomocysteinase